LSIEYYVAHRTIPVSAAGEVVQIGLCPATTGTNQPKDRATVMDAATASGSVQVSRRIPHQTGVGFTTAGKAVERRLAPSSARWHQFDNRTYSAGAPELDCAVKIP